ncbi:MAG: hypothetical protein WAN87_00330 [Thermoplasmata archaeon]
MSDSEAVPQFRTGALWGVLAILLVVGTVAAAAVVYGVTNWLLGGAWWIALLTIGVGAVVSVIALMLMVGVLYRVDRFRGTPHKEMRLFE